jgi:hypothetical protein
MSQPYCIQRSPHAFLLQRAGVNPVGWPLYALLGLLLVAGAGPDDAKKIQGEWRCTSLVHDGEKVKLPVVTKTFLTLDEENYVKELNGRELRRHRYKLFPEDGVILFEVKEGTYFLGRYELNVLLSPFLSVC